MCGGLLLLSNVLILAISSNIIVSTFDHPIISDQHLKKDTPNGCSVDLVINLNSQIRDLTSKFPSSPFHTGCLKKRLRRCSILTLKMLRMALTHCTMGERVSIGLKFVALGLNLSPLQKCNSFFSSCNHKGYN